MKLTFLGTSASVPTQERGLSSVAIARGNEILLFDTGEGMQLNFLKARLGMNKKMKIFITHMHADHCLGLLGLLQTLSLHGRENILDIYGQPKLAEFVRENMKIVNFRLSFDMNLHIIDAEGVVAKEKDYQVTCCKADHFVSAYSYCLTEFDRPGIFNVNEAKRLGIPEGELYGKLRKGQDVTYNGKTIKSHQIVGPPRPGRRIGISGDTRPTEKLRIFFMECDVLVFESTYSHEKQQKAIENFHSTSKEAAMLASSSRVRKLLLTHFSARYSETSQLINEARCIHRDVVAAEDLKEFEIPYREKNEEFA